MPFEQKSRATRLRFPRPTLYMYVKAFLDKCFLISRHLQLSRYAKPTYGNAPSQSTPNQFSASANFSPKINSNTTMLPVMLTLILLQAAAATTPDTAQFPLPDLATASPADPVQSLLASQTRSTLPLPVIQRPPRSKVLTVANEILNVDSIRSRRRLSKAVVVSTWV